MVAIAESAIVKVPKLTPPGKDSCCCMNVFEVAEDGCVRLGKIKQDLVELF